MFTGIVETIGEIVQMESVGQNKKFVLRSSLVPELKIDQSISHNGTCLTIEQLNIDDNLYQVSAIHETLQKTTLGTWKIGDKVNIERAMTLDQRLDGHMVQGHVDRTIHCLDKIDQDGSTKFTFDLPKSDRHLLIPKGSVTLDGMSLTVAELSDQAFAVAIIPYTLEHTIVQYWEPGRLVNVEYDVFAKYLARYRELYMDHLASAPEIAG